MTVGRIPVIEGGIQPTIFDAKADLLTATANDTPARLAVGTNGQVLTADSSTSTGLKWAVASGSTFAGCLVVGNTQTIANNTDTAVTFAGTEVFDTDAFHSTATNTSRITIPADKAGYYQFYYQGTWENANAGARQVRINKNGSALSSSYVYTNFGGLAGGYYTQVASIVANVAVADYFEVFVQQASGGNLALYGPAGAGGNLPGLIFGCTYLGA
jgi:hypothetical protein